MAEVLAATPPSSTPPNPPSLPKSSEASPSTSAAVSGAAIVQFAMRYLGYPYTATGNSPATGFSCIGFVSYVYNSLGINLPGDLQDAYAFAPQVPFSDLLPGDILYFQNTVWAGLSHAAIYIGGGRFVHAEWYGYGVRISSFNNDPKDGDYWIGHYLGANRPWTGAAVAVVPTAGTTGGTSTGRATAGASTTTVQGVASGPAALVTVPSLNVRVGPSKTTAVQTVVEQGTSLIVLGKSHGWYKVQLPNGTVGWVVSEGIGTGASTTAASTTASSTAVSTSPTTASAASTGIVPAPSGQNGLVGNPTAPTATQSTLRHHRTAASRVDGLRVHTTPGLTSPVTTSLMAGQHFQVLARRHGWVKIRLSDGTVGWVSSRYVSGKKSVTKPALSQTVPSAAARVPVVHFRKTAAVSLNILAMPSLNGSIITVLPAGGNYRVLGWSNGWAHVELPNGTEGWIAPARLRSGVTSQTSPATSRTAQGGSVVTVTVRLHSAPGINAPVVGAVPAGTHVSVLSRSGGWALVRLPGGQTGYIIASSLR